MKPPLYAVLPRPPHPTRDGSTIRNYHLLAGLSEEFRVRSFALRAPHLPAGEYPAGIEPLEIPQSGRAVRRAFSAAASLAGGDPYSARLYRSRALEDELARAVRQEKPEWVVSLSYHVGPAALAAGRAWIDFQNLDSRIWSRIAGTASSPAVRVFASIQTGRVELFERRLLERAAGVSCVSATDAAAMRELAPAACPVIAPNGVDLDRYAFRPEPSPEPLLFFVGDLSWPPNAEGVRWFLRHVWPRVRQQAPEAAVEVLGREPPRDLLAGQCEGFRMLGEGVDTRPHWRRAAIAIVPLLAGGGTRLKILEAAASGVPVVSTSIGAEGLDLQAGSEIVIRDDPREFASEISRLLSDPEARRRQAAAARERVEREHGWTEIARGFARAVRLRDARQ